MPFQFLLKRASNGTFLSSSRSYKNVTASVTPPDDSRLLEDCIALLPKWNCCCMFESYVKLKNFSKIVFSSVSTVNIQPGSVQLSWLLGCQMKTFLDEFWVPYWEEKIGVSNLEAAILCFLIWITCILQCFDLFQSCVWNCSFLLSLLRVMKTAGHSQWWNSPAFLFFSKLVA